jgi:hypothetical protein
MNNFFFGDYSLTRSRFSSRLLMCLAVLLKLQNEPKRLEKTKIKKQAKMVNAREYLFIKKICMS